MSDDGKFFYANSVQIAVSAYDMSFKFTRNGTESEKIVPPPGTIKTDVSGVVLDELTVAMSPSHAKAVLAALKQIVDIYERQFGPIPVPPDVVAKWNESFPSPKV